MTVLALLFSIAICSKTTLIWTVLYLAGMMEPNRRKTVQTR